MFEAVIFDFDGVILDSEPIHYEAFCSVLKNIGLTITYEEYVEKYVGLSDKEMFPRLLTNKGYDFTANDISSFINQKRENYIPIINNHLDLPFIADVDRYICNLIQEKKQIAICSGSTRKEVMAALAKLKQGDLLAYFNPIVTSEEVQAGKPSPAGYLLTAKYLGISPDKCLVIEDSPHGITAAKKAGMYVIAIQTTYDKCHLQYADKIISGFADLLD